MKQRNTLIREIIENDYELPSEYKQIESENVKKTYEQIQKDIKKLNEILEKQKSSKK